LFLLKEILESIKNHKSKSFIAGVTVSWGLILLILLVGTGQGLEKGIAKLFSDYTIKTVEVYGNEASISDLSVSKGDLITFNNQDIYTITKSFDEIEHISPILRINVDKVASYKKQLRRFSLVGVNDEYFKIKTLTLKNGRFFNHSDSDNKVIVIGEKIAESLFNNAKCIGQLIFIKGIGYTVIGVVAKGNLFSNDSSSIFMPYNIASAFIGAVGFNDFILSVTSQTDITEFKKMLNAYLAIQKGFNSKDKQAIIFDSVEESLKTFNTLFKSINIFLWFVSISFLVSGMLSIFNVMTIIVKDRTGEFGIRKALGATPISIQKMVLLEALIITIISGVLGLLIGYLIIIMTNLYININSNHEPFLTIEINFPIVFGALLLLILTGCIAGIVPARKASNIMPVEALRQLGN